MAVAGFPLARLGVLVGGQGVSSALGLVNVSIAAHILPAASFGFLATGLALAQGLRMAVSTQCWQALVRHRGGGMLRLATTLAALEHALGLCAGLAFLLLLHLGAAPMGLTPEAVGSLSWLAVGMAAYAADPWLGVLHARHRQGMAAMVQGGGAVLRCAGIVAAAACGAGLECFVLAHVCADLLATVLAATLAATTLGAGPRRLLRALARPLAPRRQAMRFPGLGRLLASGSAISILGALAAHLDVPVAAVVLGPEEAGRYRLLRAMGALALILATPLRQICLSYWTEAGGRDLRPLLRRWWLAGPLIAAAGIAGFALVAERLMPVAFGPLGAGLGAPACIMLAAASLALLAAPAQALLVARHGELWNSAGQAALVATHFTLLPMLAAAGGLALAAWSLIAAQAALFLVVGLAAWRRAGGSHGA